MYSPKFLKVYMKKSKCLSPGLTHKPWVNVLTVSPLGLDSGLGDTGDLIELDQEIKGYQRCN